LDYIVGFLAIVNNFASVFNDASTESLYEVDRFSRLQEGVSQDRKGIPTEDVSLDAVLKTVLGSSIAGDVCHDGLCGFADNLGAE